MTAFRLSCPLVVAVLLSAGSAMAQLSLAPTFVYVDSPERVGSMVVTNSSTTVQEVIIDYDFGYPSADSMGRRFVQYDDADAAERFDLSGWIRSFPQRFRIEPGRRQVVRMLVQPPHGLADGIYWTRMTITTSEPAHSASSGSTGTSARIDFKLKQVIPIVYRKGRSTTSAQVTDLLVEPGERGTDLRAVITRDGDVPFFGSVVMKLTDDSGRTVKEISTSSEVYFTSSTHFRIDAADVPAGSYTAEARLVPQRSDVPAKYLPAMNPVVRQFSIEIPEPAPAVADAK